MNENTPIPEINQLVIQAQEAFLVFKQANAKQRADFMHRVADEIEALGPELIATAQSETNLPEARLNGEKARTAFQWRSYADALTNSNILPVQIDTSNPDRTPPKPDIRKTYVGVGVVVVFGASNFPFAFSTSGGDTASAIAAGCSVIFKSHSGHPETSKIMAGAIERAIQKTGLPSNLFAAIATDGVVGGQHLVKHHLVKAVGFTGSIQGGRALFDIASQRPEPIPVFAEMGSVNPVVLLPERLAAAAEEVANQYAQSLTLGVGQFCTNPGIFIAPNDRALPRFLTTLQAQITQAPSAPMLHSGIAASYHKNKADLLAQDGVEVLAEVPATTPETHGNATIATVSAQAFLGNPKLSEEVFGPFGLIVTYDSPQELLAVTQRLEGQLTATLLAEPAELAANRELVAALADKSGRVLFNGFPTGVEVCGAMQHGGPYPAATDSRFTSVGPDAIKRFARPVSYQNFPDEVLPDELKNANPLGIWRTVNGTLTKAGL
ncbi:2,5-dioxovalerate dehydrogenase [Parapedobacter pyrenivorans]|uniref:2,5-dioxovalerate dehydrogenase n=1 Tax=Parapedobacter pyrenivorans TaxID=1305674 RepID=A0A917M5R2_9SPHI|nr:aldehyde dehydrogenase (NADP(+)) [Parapedobacter pyrenivorans]GGG76677.1 2,5-dioxovalerate dehydrogenase [Parapedobacter pyrenivorans]